MFFQLAKAVFVSDTVSKLLDTVHIVSVSSPHISRLFTVTTKFHLNIISIKFVSQFPADFTILIGNCIYTQTAVTVTCGSGAVAGSGTVGTDPFTRVSVEAKPAWY